MMGSVQNFKTFQMDDIRIHIPQQNFDTFQMDDIIHIPRCLKPNQNLNCSNVAHLISQSIDVSSLQCISCRERMDSFPESREIFFCRGCKQIICKQCYRIRVQSKEIMLLKRQLKTAKSRVRQLKADLDVREKSVRKFGKKRDQRPARRFSDSDVYWRWPRPGSYNSPFSLS